jgi:hypothetical protein
MNVTATAPNRPAGALLRLLNRARKRGAAAVHAAVHTGTLARGTCYPSVIAHID